jgi:hypothetical protein
MNSRFVMTIAMLVIFTVMVAIGSRYPAGARFMIFVVGFPAIGLCLLQLFLDFRESRNAARATSAEIPTTLPEAAAMQMNMTGAGLTVEAYTPEVVRKELIMWGYVLALIAGILLFGFYITVPIFLVVFLRAFAGASWPMALGLPAVVCVFLYVILGYVFRMTLHTGFVTEYLMDRIGG